jgi:hypothetical protein
MWNKKFDKNCHFLEVYPIGKHLVYYYEGEGFNSFYLCFMCMPKGQG